VPVAVIPAKAEIQRTETLRQADDLRTSLKRSTPGPHGHRVTLTAAPSPSPSSSGKNRDRVEAWNPIEKSHAAPGDWPPGHDRQCSALSGRRWTSPTPDGGAL